MISSNSLYKRFHHRLLLLLPGLVVLAASEHSLHAQSFNPVPWPSSFTPYSVGGLPIKDPAVQDPSNGGTSPQGYVNIASGTPDQTRNSVLYGFDGSTIFIRFRLEGQPTAYTGGASASNSDPWQPASWVFLIDVDGDGWRDFAVFLDGSSGAPGFAIDRIKVIYSNLKTTQSVDPATSGVYLLKEILTAQAYTSGAFSGQLKQFDGNGNVVNTNVWPLGKNTIAYDFGTSRSFDSTSVGGGYFIDFQLPLSALDGSAYGGPVVTANTPMSFCFTTANSNVNPFQKDAAYLGVITPSTTAPMPGGDITTFNGTPITAPIIKTVTATPCPTVTLTTTVLARMKVVSGVVTTTVTAVNFYYWKDANGNGLADDAGGSWTLIGAGTQGVLGTWTRSWNTSSLGKGLYLVKVIASDDLANSTDSYTQSYGIYGSTTALVNNNCGIAPPFVTKTVTPSSVLSTASAAARTVTYTIKVTNPGVVNDSISVLRDYLPTGFTFGANAGGSMSPTTSPSNGSSGTITWTFSPKKSVAAGSSDSLSFTVVAGSTAGTFRNSAAAVGTIATDSVVNTAPVLVTDASLTLVKSVSPAGTLSVGSTVTYTITYTNSGTIALSGVSVTDSLVTGLTFGTANAGGTYNSGTRKITWSLGTLAVGATGSLTTTDTVANPFSGQNPLTNQAVGTASELSSPAASNTVSSSVSSPVLIIENTVSPSTAVPTSALTYTITYGNTGTASATNDTVRTTLPASLTYVAGSATPVPTSVSGQSLKWGFPSIASGSVNNTITFLATVNSYASPVQNQQLIDTASITSTQTAIARDTAVVLITAVPSVSIIKSSDSVSYAGSTVKFRFTLTNNGAVTATISSLVDSLPTGFTYINGSSQGMATANPSGTTGRITWSSLARTTIASGATDSLVFQATVTTAGNYTNTGKAFGTLTTAGSTDSISSQLDVTKFVLSGGSGSLIKSVDKNTVFQGDSVAFTLTYTNNSASQQNSLTIKDTLPAYFRWNNSSVTTAGTVLNNTVALTKTTGSPTRDILTWSMGNPYKSGDWSKIVFGARDSSGTPDNTVLTNTLRGATAFTGSSNTVVVTSRAIPRIGITKKVSQTSAARNTYLSYTIVYRDSSGAGASTTTTLVDTLLSNKLVYVLGSANKNGTYSTVSGTGGRIVWNLGTLTAGAVDSVTFQAQDTAFTGSVTNTATITNAEGNRATSSVSTTTASNPILTLTKSVDKTLAGPGDTLTYILTLSNTGNGSATVDSILDVTPTNTTYLSSSPAAVVAPSVGGTGTVKFNVGTITASSTTACTLKVVVTTPLAFNSVTAVSNSASNKSSQIAVIFSNSVTTTIAYPSLSINKTVDKATALPGDTLTYTLTVSNSSLISSTTTTLLDTLPANTTFVSATGGGTFSSPRITWNLGTLAANSSTGVMFKLRVNSPLTNGTRITNIPYVTTAKMTGVIAGNSVSTVIQSAPVLTIAKSVDSATASPGNTLTYTITYGNSGDADAESFSLTDPIPANTSYVLGSVSGTGTSYDITGNRIVLSRATLAAGAAGQTATFRVKVNSPLAAGTVVVTNTATAQASNASGVSASANTTINIVPVIAVTKTAPAVSYLHGSPTPRDTISYSIGFSVTGGAVIDSVYLNDVLPSGLTYVSSSPTATSVTGQNVKWSIGTVTPDTSGIVTIRATTATAATYANTATLTRRGPVTTTGNTTSTQIVNTVTGTIAQNSPIRPGGTDTVTVNDADLKGEGVIFVETRNRRTQETEVLGLSETGTNTGIFKATVATTFGVSAGTNNSGSFNVQAGDTLRGRYVDAFNAAGVTDSVFAITLTIGGTTATISANPVLIAANDSSTYTLTDADLNHNNASAESYTLTVRSRTGETESMVFTETGVNTGVFTRTVPTVFGSTPGANNNGFFTAQAGDTISVSYHDTLTTPGDTATVSTFFRIGTVLFSSSSKTLSDLNGGSAKPPDTLQYSIKVKNTGTAFRSLSTALVDTVPAGVSILISTVSGGGSVSGRVITWPAFTLFTGDSASYVYNVRIDSTIQNNVAAINRAHVQASGVDQLLTASFTPVNQPSMHIAHSVNVGLAKPGDTLQYTVTYQNVGTVKAAFVTLSIPSNPTNTTYIANTVKLNSAAKTDVADGDEVVVSGGMVTVSVGTLQPGGTGVITFKVRVQ